MREAEILADFPAVRPKHIRTVVAAASPFMHLDRAGSLGGLPALFRIVHVPEAVAVEIAAGRDRGLAVSHIAFPGWVRIDADRDDPVVRLQPGLVAGAISAPILARATTADLVLIDDRAGRERPRRERHGSALRSRDSFPTRA